MDIKKVFIAVAVILLVIIGYNYYNSAQSKENRALRVAETETIRAQNAQGIAKVKSGVVAESALVNTTLTEPSKPKLVDKEAVKTSSCNSISDFSEAIMDARLKGTPIQKALSVIDESNEETLNTKKLLKNITVQAYKEFDYRTDESKERAIREFALKQYLACVSAFDES